MMKNYLIALIFAVTALPLSLRAEVVENLYSALIPVADHSESERNNGLREGLLHVLVRLSGDSTVSQKPEVRALLSKAAQYTVSYSYRATPEGETPQALQVKYADTEIDRFMRTAQLQVWPARRPNLLLWVVAETPDAGKHFVTPESAPELYGSLNRLFDDRGLPVTYPLLDLEDQLTLSAADAWELNPETLAAASDRYRAQAWLVVRAYQTSGLSWQVAWVLSSDDRLRFDDSMEENLEVALAKIGQRSVDEIAASYAYIPSLAEGQVGLEVSGVNSFKDFSEMMALFKGLSMVRNVALQRVSGDRVFMMLRIEGEEKPLYESLTLSQRFLMPDQVAMERQLSLAWKPR